MINLNCDDAMGDFELASINSFNQRNPLCELTGCFFHLSQYIGKFKKNVLVHYMSMTICFEKT
ncbi:LOW QUALITY PROTEIN: hypothetical protein HZS_4129 [Henneguya salminicola]|nr:LOW QUALITY PROTEIN: hypothetical protein HZS_4129 [Henneguya salminicola]